MNAFGKELMQILDERGMTVPDLVEELEVIYAAMDKRPLSAWLISSMMTADLFERPHADPMFFYLLGEVLGLDREEVIERILSPYGKPYV